MTNQLQFSPLKTASNSSAFWLICKIMLSVLLFCTIISSLNFAPSTLIIFNLILGFVLIAAILWIKLKPAKTQLIKIEDGKLQYFCPIKKENIKIPVQQIIKVSSHFCELQIHTCDQIYLLNLKHIKQEKQRWEVKEMIKSLALDNEKRACNF